MRREDVSVLTHRARSKLVGLRDSAPLFLPARAPIGRQLTVGSGLSDGSGSLEAREVLAARSLDLGAEGSLDVPPLHAFSIQPALLITDARAFAAFVSDTNTIVEEVSEDYRGQRGEFASLRRLQRLPPRRTVGSVVSLLTGGGGTPTYFHWLYDVLPRIHLLEQAGYVREGDRYLVPRLAYDFQRETLEQLGIDPATCVEVTGPTIIEAQRIAVSAGHRSYRRVEPWIPRFLRERLLDAPLDGGRRLYVNRRDTKVRTVLNEDRLEAALAGRGFESVSMGGLPFREKVRLYSSAEIVVAPHGAGLANIAFCSPGTRVVDITGDYYWPVFVDVSAAMELEYLTVDALHTVGSRYVPKQIRHLEVDVDPVMDRVDALVR